MQSNLAFREENTRCNKETRKARYGAREKVTKNVCTCVHKKKIKLKNNRGAYVEN